MGYKHFSYVNTLANITQPKTSVVTGSRFSGEIALFTTAFFGQSHFAALMLDKFQQELSHLGYTLNTHRVNQNCLRNRTLPITFIKERASAIICIEMFNREYDEMICSFDDAPESRILTPSLTTIHIHTQSMAFTAAHLLMSRIKEPSLDYRVVHTETDLICRDSTKF